MMSGAHGYLPGRNLLHIGLLLLQLHLIAMHYQLRQTGSNNSLLGSRFDGGSGSLFCRSFAGRVERRQYATS